MTIANCPRCCEQVSVPEQASREATVRCPLCQEEYCIAEALAQLPPSLIIVSDAGTLPAAELANEEDSPWSSIGFDDQDVDELALAPTDETAAADSFDFTSGAATVGKSKVAVRPGSRSRKPKGSPIKSVLSIVIGGLLAFPIAQLILWYLPGNLKRDFGAGPVVAQYIPAIVPARFRGNSSSSKSDSEADLQNSGSVIPDFSFGGTGEFAGSDTSKRPSAELNNSNVKIRKKKSGVDSAAAPSGEPPADELMSLEDAASAGETVFGGSVDVPGLELGGLSIDEPTSDSDDTKQPQATQLDATPQLPPLDDAPPAIEPSAPDVANLAPGKVRNAPQVSADTVVQSVQAAVSANQTWDQNDSESPSSALKRAFYLAFSKLGEALTYANRSDETVAAQLDMTTNLLHEIAAQPDKLAVIGGVANGWIAAGYETRTTNGICVHGVVKSIEPLGSLFESTIESGGKQIAVVSTSDPTEFFTEESQVLILGTILDNPARNLGGYEGDRASVVLDGFHIRVSAN